MDQSTLAILIIVIAVISFMLEKIPLAMTAIFASLAMAIFGIIDLSKAYSDFGTTSSVMCASMMIVGNTLFETGAAELMGKKLSSIGIDKNERLFLIGMTGIAFVISAFLSNSATIAMLIPLISVIASKSDGRIKSKNIIMAAGMAASIGGVSTLVGSTPQLVAQGMLEQTEGCTTMGMFTLTKLGIPLCIIMMIYFATIGYKIEKKVLDFEDPVLVTETTDETKYDKRKVIISSIVMIGCVIGFATGIWNVAIVGLLGAAVLITTGCISFKQAMAGVDWNTIVIISASQGFAKGLETSGAAALIADKTIEIFGGAASPAIILAGLFVVATILTNFMSCTAVVAMFTPIAISIALSLGSNPLAFAIAMVVAGNTATATPVGTPCVTQTLVAGYRYKDYVKVGLPLTIILVVASAILIPILYGI